MARGTALQLYSMSVMPPLAVYADGEPLTSTPVTFALSEQRLRIVVPAS